MTAISLIISVRTDYESEFFNSLRYFECDKFAMVTFAHIINYNIIYVCTVSTQ